MSDNVRLMPGVVNAPPDVILRKAQDWELDQVVVIGWSKDGEFRIGGSHGRLSDISWLLRNAENWMDNMLNNDE